MASCKGSGDGFVSKTAMLEVKNGTPLAKGESAKFYLAVKPFEAAAGAELTLDVNGCTKKIELASNVKFHAGKIKTLNFSYDYVEEPSQEDETAVTISFENATGRTSCSTTEQVWENDGVTFKNTKTSESSNVVDNVNPIRLYKNSTISFSAPSNITKIEFSCNSAEKGIIHESTLFTGSSASGAFIY